MKHEDIDHTGLTGVGGGLEDQDSFTFLDATEAAAPATPASGKVRIYAKSDGRIYSKDDAGVESGPFDAAGAGGGPLLLVDSVALHADGSDFSDATLSDFTLVGIAIPGDVTAVTTEPYDDTCLDIKLSAGGDRLWVPAPAGDFTAYLTVHGITNSTPSPSTALGALLGLAFTDNAGTGTGVSMFSDTLAYMWGISSFTWASTGNSFGQNWPNSQPAAASNWPVVYKLAKVGTTITGGFSFNGGLTFAQNTRTDSTTFTRVHIGRIHASLGGTDPVLRVGRFNIV